MARYRILWHERQYHESFVEAESESAARQCWIDGFFDEDDLLDGERDAESGIDEIEELDDEDDLLDGERDAESGIDEIEELDG